MADENERFEELVAGLIREQLEQGNLDRLIQAYETVQASTFTLKIHPRLGMDVVKGPAVDLSGEGDLAVDAKTVDADILIQPTASAELKLLTMPPDVVVDAIESASPELANKIRVGGPNDAAALINLFAALVSLLTAALTIYQILHPQQPATPTQIIQIFNNSVHQTIANLPPSPAHGAG